MVKVHYCSVSKSEWLLSTKKREQDIYIYSGNKDLQAWSKNQSCQAQSILSGNKKGLPHMGSKPGRLLRVQSQFLMTKRNQKKKCKLSLETGSAQTGALVFSFMCLNEGSVHHPGSLYKPLHLRSRDFKVTLGQLQQTLTAHVTALLHSATSPL